MGYRSSLRNTLISLVLVALYFLSAKLGFKLAYINPSATAVWPPTGLTLAALILLGRRFWPAIFIGAFLANLTTAGTVATSVAIATGNTFEGWLGATLVWRFAGGKNAFYRFQDILRFVGLAAILATAASATIGVTTLALAGFAPWSQYASIWFTWWLGDAVSNMVIAPFIVLWWVNPRNTWRLGQWLEALVLVSFLFLIGEELFHGRFVTKVRDYFLPYLCVPLFLWAAYRFGGREAATAIFALSAIAISGVWQGVGPFVRTDPQESLILLQAFMGISAFITLIVGAVVTENRVIQARDMIAIKRGEEELRQKNEELKRLSQVKDEFVTIVTHELRTPLSAIKEGIYLVLEGVDGPVTPEQSKTLGIVRRNVDRLARMVSNVLDFQKLGSSVGWMNFARCNVKTVVEEVCQTMRFEVEKKPVQLLTWVPDSGVFAECDGDRVKQVLMNLIDNAVKFVDEGGNITVSLLEPLDTPDEIKFVVEDTGIGIKKEDQDRIFDMFSQSAHAGHWKAGGFGVGLTVCKRIVDFHGGRIWIESVEGQGSRFIFTLPRRGPGPSQSSPQAAPDRTVSG